MGVLNWLRRVIGPEKEVEKTGDPECMSKEKVKQRRRRSWYVDTFLEFLKDADGPKSYKEIAEATGNSYHSVKGKAFRLENEGRLKKSFIDGVVKVELIKDTQAEGLPPERDVCKKMVQSELGKWTTAKEVSELFGWGRAWSSAILKELHKEGLLEKTVVDSTYHFRVKKQEAPPMKTLSEILLETEEMKVWQCKSEVAKLLNWDKMRAGAYLSKLNREGLLEKKIDGGSAFYRIKGEKKEEPQTPFTDGLRKTERIVISALEKKSRLTAKGIASIANIFPGTAGSTLSNLFKRGIVQRQMNSAMHYEYWLNKNEKDYKNKGAEWPLFFEHGTYQAKVLHYLRVGVWMSAEQAEDGLKIGIRRVRSSCTKLKRYGLVESRSIGGRVPPAQEYRITEKGLEVRKNLCADPPLKIVAALMKSSPREELTCRDIAKVTGISNGNVWRCLDTLVYSGEVEVSKKSGTQKYYRFVNGGK